MKNFIPTKLRSGDEVIVVAGKDIGKKGTLREIIKSKNRAIVTGINMVKKHTKPNPHAPPYLSLLLRNLIKYFSVLISIKSSSPDQTAYFVLTFFFTILKKCDLKFFLFKKT